MKQKFLRGTRIKVDDAMPPSMTHFEKGFIGIVDHTYSQAYGGNDIKSYCIVQLNKDGQPINKIAWYQEDQLTLISDDLKAGEEILESYNIGDIFIND
jgi:hypothetical protein